MERQEAIKNVRSFIGQLTPECQESIRFLIPELAESEDERIRTALVKHFQEKRNCIGDTWAGMKVDNVLAWLERQKEQKPVQFKNDELVEIIKGHFEEFRRLLKKKGIDYEPQRGYWEGFAYLFDSSAREYVKEQQEQKPAEWSEEDEKMWMDIKCHMIHGSFIPFDKIEWLENRLKSLRPQPHWKPSDEQMEALHKAIKKAYHDYDARPLESLYTELLKLKQR